MTQIEIALYSTGSVCVCVCVCVCVGLTMSDNLQKSSLQMLANLTVVFCQQIVCDHHLVRTMSNYFMVSTGEQSTLPRQTQKLLLNSTVAAVCSPKTPTAAHTVLHIYIHTHTYTCIYTMFQKRVPLNSQW